MKIIIVGGGIGGLTVYHSIRKHLPDVDVQLYEAYPTPLSSAAIIGGGLGLAPNGQRVLADVFPGSVEYLKEHGFTSTSFLFRDEKGRDLGRMAYKVQPDGFSQMMVARADVHQSLLLGVEEDDHLHWGKKVASVKEVKSHVEVTFEDGTSENYDIAIGADGIRSVCREAIFGSELFKPGFNGLNGIGGFVPVARLPKSLQDGIKTEPIVMTFSRSGFFGYARSTPASLPIDQQSLIWWSTFESASPLSRDSLPDNIQDLLLARHESWQSPYDTKDAKTFRDIIRLAYELHKTDALKWQVLPRYALGQLPYWTSAHNTSAARSTRHAGGRIVLIGDAAHVMPPDSGQGVSCAAEDAVTFALLLKHYLKAKKSEAEAIKQTALAYDDLRVPRVNKILEFAKYAGDGKRELGWFGEKMRNFGLWVITRMPDGIKAPFFAYDANDEVQKYLRKKT